MRFLQFDLRERVPGPIVRIAGHSFFRPFQVSRKRGPGAESRVWSGGDFLILVSWSLK